MLLKLNNRIDYFGIMSKLLENTNLKKYKKPFHNSSSKFKKVSKNCMATIGSKTVKELCETLSAKG